MTSTATTSTTPEPAARPNIVVLNLDDMRADSLAQMPKTLQWMAQGGTSFVNAYVTTPSCCPSRAGLLSGRYVHNNGQYQQENQGLNMDLTVQRYMHDAGLLHRALGQVHPVVATVHDRSALGPLDLFQGRLLQLLVKQDNTRLVGTVADQLDDPDLRPCGINFLTHLGSDNDAKPFLHYLAPVAPHWPSTPESKYASASVPAHALTRRTETDLSDKPPFVRNRSISTTSTCHAYGG